MRKSLIMLGILDDSDVEWSLRTGFRERVETGTALIKEGEPLDSVYIVLGGSFDVSVGQARKKIARIYAGDIVGEMSFVDSAPPSATVTATEESFVLTIPRSEIKMRLDEDMAFGYRFFRALTVLLARRLRETVSNLGYGVQGSLNDDDDEDQLPDDLLENMAIAGKRFTILQGRARSSPSV